VFVPDAPPEEGDVSALIMAFSAVFAPGGGAGPAAATWVPGGFRRWRLDLPGRTLLYANQQGGFQVRCPVDEQSIVGEFSRSLSARTSLDGAAELDCPCGARHRLDALVFRPPAAFGRFALVLHDVGSGSATAEAISTLSDRWGPLRIVPRRVS
jgi:hypothetical protein